MNATGFSFSDRDLVFYQSVCCRSEFFKFKRNLNLILPHVKEINKVLSDSSNYIVQFILVRSI